jgi:hypothetical protein
MMTRYEDITEARKLFGIAEAETIGDVKKKINALIKRWHPDTGSGERKEKTTALLKSKKVIMDYYDTYKISFRESTVNKYPSPGKLWLKCFGNDHVWGGGAGE